MADYILREPIIGGVGIEITEGRYSSLLASNELIGLIFQIEEFFSLLADAFVDFETELLHLCLEYFYTDGEQRHNREFFDDARQKLNLKLVSFLASSRIYEDQVIKKVGEINRGKMCSADVNHYFSEAFDSSIEYRVMHALRNYALHQNIPMNYLSFHSSNLNQYGHKRAGKPSRLRVTIEPMVSVKDFVAAKKVRQKTRKEVSSLGVDYLNLKFLIRGFVSLLAGIHENIRQSTQVILDDAFEDLGAAHEELRKAKGSYPRFISISGRGPDSELDIDYPESLRLHKVRRKWSRLKSVQRGYVSSEIVKDDNAFPLEHASIWIPN